MSGSASLSFVFMGPVMVARKLLRAGQRLSWGAVGIPAVACLVTAILVPTISVMARRTATVASTRWSHCGPPASRLALWSALTGGVWDVARVALSVWCLGGSPPLCPGAATELDAHTSHLARHGACRVPPHSVTAQLHLRFGLVADARVSLPRFF